MMLAYLNSSAKLVDDGILPCHEIALLDMMAGIGHEAQIEREVVDAGYLHRQQLLGLEEVVEVGLRGYEVDVAAVWIYRTEVFLPLLVAHVHRALIGEEHGVAAVTGRHYAVEHVYAALDGFEDVLRGSYAHQISRLVFRQDFVHYFYHLIHHLGRLSYGKSADGISVGSLVGNVFGCFAAQVREGAALNDREETLLIAVEGLGFVEPLDAAV